MPTTTPVETYTSNLSLLKMKLTQILQEGPNKFRIVSDFDSTLSAPCSPSSWCVVEHSTVLSDTYRLRSKHLSELYYPKEIDPTLTIEERSQFMVEWWAKAQHSLRDEHITRQQYNEILVNAQRDIFFRQGVDDMFSTSHRLNIPLVVFSAGVGDVIDAVFIKHFAYYHPTNHYYPIHHLPEPHLLHKKAITPNTISPNLISHHTQTHPHDEFLSPVEYGAVQGIPKNIYIIANHFNFKQQEKEDQLYPLNPTNPGSFQMDDLICGFLDETPIHVFNKHEVLIQDTPYYQQKIKPFTNACLLGDSLGDALMVATDAPGNVIRLGFLQTNPKHSKTKDTHLSQYLHHFDLVFVDNDGGVAFLNEMLNYWCADGHDEASVDDIVKKMLDNVIEEKL